MITYIHIYFFVDRDIITHRVLNTLINVLCETERISVHFEKRTYETDLVSVLMWRPYLLYVVALKLSI